MRRSSGFTLIELMVTLLVLAVLVVIALPSFTSFFEKSRLRGAADDLTSLISTARTEAAKNNRDITLSMRGSSSTWCMGANQVALPANPGDPITFSNTECQCDSAPASCAVDGNKRVVDSSQYRGVTVAAGDIGKTFGIDGIYGATLAPATPSTTLCTQSFSLTSSSGKYKVTLKVSPLGQTQVCIPAGSTFISGYPTCTTTTSTACS